MLCVTWSMQIYTMDSQYEIGNVTEYDVVRSTQFVEEIPLGVCAHSFLGPQLGLVLQGLQCRLQAM